MGHDIIQFHGGHVVLHDHDLLVVRHFVLLQMEADGEAELTEFVRNWEWIANGVWLGIDFDSVFNGDAGKKERFVKSLHGAAQRIAQFGTEIPISYLHDHFNSPTLQFTSSQPSERWLQVIQGLIRLLQPAH